MTMDHSECNRLFEAGKALLVKSGLVCWDGQAFAPGMRATTTPNLKSGGRKRSTPSSEGTWRGCCLRLARRIW